MLYKFSRSESENKPFSLLKQAGYARPTLIQEKIVPIALQGRDVIVETYGSKGKTAAFLLPALLRPDFSAPGKGPAVLILTPDENRISKISKQIDKLLPHSTSGGRKPRIAPLALEKNPKRELRCLSDNPDVIIGTTARIIDHIRRDNLDVKNVELLVITSEQSLEEEGFIQDVLFISSKMEKRQQTLIFSSHITNADLFSELVHRPQVLTFHEWQSREISHSFFTIPEGKEKPLLLRRIIRARRIKGGIIICRSYSQAAAAEKKLKEGGISCSILSGKQARNRPPEVHQEPNIFLIGTVKSCRNHIFEDVGSLIYYSIPHNAGTYMECISFLGGGQDKVEIISLVSNREKALVKRIEEEFRMKIHEDKLPEQNEAVQEQIRQIIKAIKEEENPAVLEKYKKIVKKRVPFFLRSYFTAYLLKNTLGSELTKPQDKTLFVSVGKNRKVFPRDLARLFSAALDIESSDIGNIKILDNYSFIDIPESRAQEAIDKLNGNEYRGRNITVNYARKREGPGGKQ